MCVTWHLLFFMGRIWLFRALTPRLAHESIDLIGIMSGFKYGMCCETGI